MTVVTLTSGTAFIMWLGEQITERGIGNGMSLIIFAGIVARLPSAIWSTFQFMRNGELGPLVALVMLVLSVVDHWRDYFRRTRPAAHSGAIRQAGGRPEHVRRHDLPLAVKG